MFNAGDLGWFDFEVASMSDLKAAGTFRYAADTSTRAIVLAYAIGNAPALTWHADGAILDWDRAPPDLRAALRARHHLRGVARELRRCDLEFLDARISAPHAGARHRSDDPGRRLQLADRSRTRLALSRRCGQTERRQGADQAVLHRGRRAQRASREMAALSLLCAPGRRGDARGLSPDATAAARRMASSTGRSNTSIGAVWQSTCRSFATPRPWRPRTPSPLAAG